MPRSKRDFRVVCLGGSAGGLEGYLAILRRLPADLGMAFVIAPHRSPNQAHLLPEILSKVTPMPVLEIKEGMAIKPNRVFVIPPRVDLTISHAVFHLREMRKRRGWPETITIFLYSLAEAVGRRAVAIILSGMDGDGSAALRAIKAAGGVTFAQADASIPSMPRHAVATGCVDFLLPASEIPAVLLALDAAPGRRR